MIRLSRRRAIRLGLILLAVLMVALFYLSGLDREFEWNVLRQRVDSLRAWVDNNLWLAILAFGLLYVAATAISLPISTGLSIVAGALFGRWIGTALVSLSSTTGATLAFLSSRFLFRESIERRLNWRLRAVQEGVVRGGGWYVLTLRLVPLFPYFLVNLALGLTRLPVRTFVWATWLGMLPVTFVFVNSGRAISRIESPRDVLSLEVIAALAMLGLVPLLLRRVIRRIRWPLAASTTSKPQANPESGWQE